MKKHNSLVIIKWVSAVSCALAIMQSANAQTVRLHGAVAFAKIIEAQKGPIEAKAGVKLEIVGNGAGRGLADLSGGQADIAMLSGDLKSVAAVMNKEKAGSVDIAEMKEIPLTSVAVACVTHPSAGVKSLTDAQLRDVLTGKAASWKDVGGADLPIKVVLPFAADGVRIAVQASLLKGADYLPGAIVRNSAKDISSVVAQVPGACAVLTVKNIEGNVITVSMETPLSMPFQLVVKGEPSSEAKKVIEAATALIK